MVTAKCYNRTIPQHRILLQVRPCQCVASKGWFLLRDTEQCTRPTCATLISYFGCCSCRYGLDPSMVHRMKSYTLEKIANKFATPHGIKDCRCVQQQWDSGQVRPARQWRARFGAQAQRAQYVHNCYLHAAAIDK